MTNFYPTLPIRTQTKWLGKALCQIPAELLKETKEKVKRFCPEKPLISVVFIAYNEEDYIFNAIWSMVQNKPKWPTELIVINNNSKDKTQEILDELGVRSYLETTQGWKAARNRGLQEARGEIMLTCDGDNMYPSTWIETMAGKLMTNDNVVCVCSLYCFYTVTNHYPAFLTFYQYSKLVNCLIRHKNMPHLNCLGGSMGFRKKDAIAVGGYMHDGRGEDGHLAFELAKKGKVEMIIKRKAFSYSNMRTVMLDGSLEQAFLVRLKKYSKRLSEYITPQKK